MPDKGEAGGNLQLSEPQAEKARITLAQKQDIQFMRDAAGARAQPMAGFNPRYADFVDWIIGITHEIWEEKGIGKLYDYYANTIQIHTSDGLIYGREAVFAMTIAALAAYPDRRLYGDDVIWGGDDVAGLYSSHRLTHEGTNRGWTVYGPPTGKRVRYSGVADCFCRRNMVVEEWIVRDELTLVMQLGLDPVKTAKEQAAKARDQGLDTQIAGDIERGIGQYPPPKWEAEESETFAPEAFIAKMFHEIWNWRLLNKTREFYAENVVFDGPSRRAFSGVNDLQTFILSLLAPFPDLALHCDHFCHVGSAAAGYRVATRWTLRGTHTGYGIYGEPTGKPIRLIGVSHHGIHDGLIRDEFTRFDEFALLKQIHG